MCASCELHTRFQTELCQKCGKSCRANATTEVSIDNVTHRLCLSCAPAEQPLTCTVCAVASHPSAFEQRYRGAAATKTGIRRCKSCSERCKDCGESILDDRRFATNSDKCWKCYNKPRTCSKCQKAQKREEFEPSALHNKYKASRRQLLILSLIHISEPTRPY